MQLPATAPFLASDCLKALLLSLLGKNTMYLMMTVASDVDASCCLCCPASQAVSQPAISIPAWIYLFLLPPSIPPSLTLPAAVLLCAYNRPPKQLVTLSGSLDSSLLHITTKWKRKTSTHIIPFDEFVALGETIRNLDRF